MFLDGRRIGFVGTVCHHLDVGGSSPGSYGSSAIEIFQEGLRIPPVKLFEQGKLNEAVRAIILQNVRQPEILWGDLQSQLASLQIGAASIERLATKVGEERFERALQQLLDTSEAGMRAVIGRIPDGTYEFEDSIDDDGITDTPIRIHAKVMVAGDEMTVDLSGCGPQAMGPSNATLASTCSAVFYALMASADVPIASNAGCYRPVKIIAPEGLCVNAAYPAPVVHRIAIAHRLATVLFGALHQAIPDRMPAAYYAVSYVVAFQTIDPGTRPQGPGRDRDRRLRGAALFRRRIGPLVRHAQQLQYPDRNDRERHAVDVPRLWPADRLGRPGPAARRARPVAGMADRFRVRAALDQSRPLQVPAVRARRGRGRGGERALPDPRRSDARRCPPRSRTSC